MDNQQPPTRGGPPEPLEVPPIDRTYAPDTQARQIGAFADGLFKRKNRFGYRRWFVPLALWVSAASAAAALIMWVCRR